MLDTLWETCCTPTASASAGPSTGQSGPASLAGSSLHSQRPQAFVPRTARRHCPAAHPLPSPLVSFCQVITSHYSSFLNETFYSFFLPPPSDSTRHQVLGKPLLGFSAPPLGRDSSFQDFANFSVFHVRGPAQLAHFLQNHRLYQFTFQLPTATVFRRFSQEP